ncbi:MAG: hypothetical protein CVT70_18000 [Alphaproteobacteria bacterium HGW-Alphaproteobacteria-1]|jgi:hypothetical protein|nr:MAG: hypothetical protein CVT70_18000 [Alphaproteobacteria bacterium HGW-Alphaproteobacteria-1]
MTAQDDDLPPDAAASKHLAIAYRVHADPDLMAAYHRKKKQVEHEGRWEYVGSVRNPDYYVLSEFDSHGQRLLEEQKQILMQIEGDLMSKLRRGVLTIWAREGSPLAPWRKIPASAWRTLKLDDVIKGTAKGPGVELFDIRMGVPVKVQAPPAAIAPPVEDDLIPKGTPGRPNKGIDIIKVEFERRAAAKELASSLAAESRTLADWYRHTYPRRECPTPKTIENNIRLDYNAAKTGQA